MQQYNEGRVLFYNNNNKCLAIDSEIKSFLDDVEVSGSIPNSIVEFFSSG